MSAAKSTPCFFIFCQADLHCDGIATGCPGCGSTHGECPCGASTDGEGHYSHHFRGRLKPTVRGQPGPNPPVFLTVMSVTAIAALFSCGVYLPACSAYQYQQVLLCVVPQYRRKCPNRRSVQPVCDLRSLLFIVLRRFCPTHVRAALAWSAVSVAEDCRGVSGRAGTNRRLQSNGEDRRSEGRRRIVEEARATCTIAYWQRQRGARRHRGRGKCSVVANSKRTGRSSITSSRPSLRVGHFFHIPILYCTNIAGDVPLPFISASNTPQVSVSCKRLVAAVARVDALGASHGPYSRVARE